MNATAQPQAPQKAFENPQFGPKVMIMGDAGDGKTHSLLSLPKVGITPFVIATEQNFVQVAKPFLGDKMHYKYIPAQAENLGWSQAADMAKKINQLSYENLCKVSDPFKIQSNKFLDMYAAAQDFKCDCCGKNWGDAAKWSTDRAFAVDSLSGLSDMAFSLVVGNKPVRAMPDYGVAQQALRQFLGICTSQVKCLFVLVAHLAREKDEITGGTTITANTVGNKLGPDLPRLFSDVIRARRNGSAYVWDTADTQAIVVARHVPQGSALAADFGPLIQKWIANGGKILPT